MYANLPDVIKQQVLRYLSADNFKAAKEIHDEWIALQDTTHNKLHFLQDFEMYHEQA
jgi:hypothetical protein